MLFRSEIIDLFLFTLLKKAYRACREVQSERRNDEGSTGSWKTPAATQMAGTA